MDTQFVNYDALRSFLEQAVTHYEKEAPAVASYLDDLYVRVNERPQVVSLYELSRVALLFESGQWEQPNHAQNRLYKLSEVLAGESSAVFGGVSY